MCGGAFHVPSGYRHLALFPFKPHRTITITWLDSMVCFPSLIEGNDLEMVGCPNQGARRRQRLLANLRFMLLRDCTCSHKLPAMPARVKWAHAEFWHAPQCSGCASRAGSSLAAFATGRRLRALQTHCGSPSPSLLPLQALANTPAAFT